MSFWPKVPVSKAFKEYLLPLVADPELVAGRGRIKPARHREPARSGEAGGVGVNP